MNTTIWLGLAVVLFLPLGLVHPDRSPQIDLDLMWLREKADKFAYCRALRLLKPLAALGNTQCGYYLRHDPKLQMDDMLLESLPKCLPGWDLLRGRCRKLV